MTHQNLQQDLRVEDLTISNQYLFGAVLSKNKDLTKQLIEKVTSIKDIIDIKYINTEETMKTGFGSKGSRYDVYVKDHDGVAYVIELQRQDTLEIPKRARYYQAISDTNETPVGFEYRKLKDNYVIFICREDIFKLGHHQYTFENICHEIPELKLGDGTKKIILNTKGTKGEIDADVLGFLKKIEGQMTDNQFAQQFETAAEKIKATEAFRRDFMQTALIEYEMKEQARQEEREKAEIEKKELVASAEAEKLTVAKNLISRGISVEDVSAATGFPIEVINSLK